MCQNDAQEEGSRSCGKVMKKSKYIGKTEKSRLTELMTCKDSHKKKNTVTWWKCMFSGGDGMSRLLLMCGELLTGHVQRIMPGQCANP